MAIKDVVKALQQFDQDHELYCQVVGMKAGAWSVGFGLSEWPESRTVVMTITHPELEYIPQDCSQPIVHYKCANDHHFIGLPNHPLIMGVPMCPYCAAKKGVGI